MDMRNLGGYITYIWIQVEFQEQVPKILVKQCLVSKSWTKESEQPNYCS